MDFSEQSNPSESSVEPSESTNEPVASVEEAAESNLPTEECPQEEQSIEENEAPTEKEPPKTPKKVALPILLAVVCIAIAVSVILTYTLTSAYNRRSYLEILQNKQAQIDKLEAEYESFEGLSLIQSMLEKYSYYADEMSEEEMIEAALKAYVAATGDRYAVYYTEEEYQQNQQANEGYVGIGVSTVNAELVPDPNNQFFSYKGFLISSITKNSPAHRSELKKGDFIYSIKIDGAYKTVNEMESFDKALSHFRGEAGTTAEFLVLRKDAETGGYQSIPMSVVREVVENPSVSYAYKDGDPKTAIVSVSRFATETPQKFRETVDLLRNSGVEHFVFDMRDNPGGELLSVKAILSYFLQKDDLILNAIDKDGNVARKYVVEAKEYTDEYTPCSVTEEQIGMYASLDMLVLCNENTASAAEVFTASLRDHKNTTVVGKKTFGKGIMQSLFDLSKLGPYSGYLKLTTYAYVTQCGVTYHDVGISPSPDCEVGLPDEALQYDLYDLPQSLDTQLQLAFAKLAQ